MLSTLKPTLVWQIFGDICKIPHPSHHEQLISQYIIDFAKSHQIDYEIDKVGNILLRKVATLNKEHYPSIALQAHMDMVPQKNEATEHDFLTDPINAYIDGEWVTAKGTTLGADNGVGLASTLAVLIDPSVQHGPLEVLITASEETGMFGAFGLEANWLRSHYLINSDSEDEGELFTGCAGGVDFCASLPITYSIIPAGHDRYVRLSLKGLKGGHSGCDIHLGRGNAIKLLVRFLAEYANEISFRLANIQGGTLRNAIPREAFAEISLSSQHFDRLTQLIVEYQTVLNNEFSLADPNIQFTFSDVNDSQTKNECNAKHVMTLDHQTTLLNWLHTSPNGVIRMSDTITGVVETSLNLGMMIIKNNQAHTYFLIRSQVDSAKNAVLSVLTSHCKLINANYEISGDYSGWQPDLSSNLLQLAKNKYHEIFSKQAKVTVIHAGLECGLFKKSYPNMDMISIGPTIVSPHSPDEKVNIESVKRYWEWLIAILQSAESLK